jgi:hypothetical protein
MHMFRTALAAACVAAAVLATAAAPPADAQQHRLQVGRLNCSLSSSVGLLVTSERNVSCIFHSDNAPDETYSGTMRRVGIDIGATSGGRIVWAVFAGTDRHAGMLDGTYVGATAEASIALGLGANVLVGGSDSSIALQPLSVQGQVGLNIAAGIGKLYLCQEGTSCPAP